jgi:hypothetical protein
MIFSWKDSKFTAYEKELPHGSSILFWTLTTKCCFDVWNAEQKLFCINWTTNCITILGARNYQQVGQAFFRGTESQIKTEARSISWGPNSETELCDVEGLRYDGDHWRHGAHLISGLVEKKGREHMFNLFAGWFLRLISRLVLFCCERKTPYHGW